MAKVVLEDVRVDFPIYGAQRSLRSAVFQRATGGLIRREGKNQEHVLVRALTDVSLSLEEGDRLGLIGHNGSGKSTLLKVIAGIYEPIRGRVMVEGRVTPLFDMMPGLDVEDTGYENLFTAGMLLGLSRDEIEKKIPEIEEFCELGEYLTLPVRTYSAGMMTRLGFALVTALNPGVLLMDEGVGAGDLRFTERAAERMNDFMGRSPIIVLASHSDSMMEAVCNKAALMREGQILKLGPVEEVLDEYHFIVHGTRPIRAAPTSDSDTEEPADETEEPPPPPPPVYSEESIRDVGVEDRLKRTTGAVRFTKAIARDESGRTRWKYRPGETVTFRFDYEVLSAVPNLNFLFRLYAAQDDEGRRFGHTVTDIREILSPGPLEIGYSGAIELELCDPKMMPNRFFLYVYFGGVDNTVAYDVIDANVSLPALVIQDDSLNSHLHGFVRLDYRLHKCEIGGADGCVAG